MVIVCVFLSLRIGHYFYHYTVVILIETHNNSISLILPLMLFPLGTPIGIIKSADWSIVFELSLINVIFPNK